MFEVIFPEDNLKKIETCRSIRGYMKSALIAFLDLLVLRIKLLLTQGHEFY